MGACHQARLPAEARGRRPGRAPAAGEHQPALLPAVPGRTAHRGCPPCGGAPPTKAARRAGARRSARLPIVTRARRQAKAPAARARRLARLPAVPGARRPARAPAVGTATVADGYRGCPRGRGRAPPTARVRHRNIFFPQRNAFCSASLESQRSNIIYERGLSTLNQTESAFFERTASRFGSLGISRTMSLMNGLARPMPGLCRVNRAQCARIHTYPYTYHILLFERGATSTHVDGAQNGTVHASLIEMMYHQTIFISGFWKCAIACLVIMLCAGRILFDLSLVWIVAWQEIRFLTANLHTC